MYVRLEGQWRCTRVIRHLHVVGVLSYLLEDGDGSITVPYWDTRLTEPAALSARRPRYVQGQLFEEQRV